MLSFKLENEGRAIQIAMDHDGMNKFITLLHALKAKGGGHMHFRTRANSGDELDERTPWGGEAIAEVIIDIFEP